MSQYEPEKYLPTIDAILGVADLEQITVKKIRNALQELFEVDLKPHKKEINKFILDRYYSMQNEQARKEKEEVERTDALLAAKLLREESSNGAGTRASRTKRRSSSTNGSSPSSSLKPTKRAAPNNAFNREMVLSSDLQNVISELTCSRPQVVKRLWAYIKDNNLQNPTDKRQIICDDKLQQLFKKKTVGAFEMNRILSKHIFKPEEVDGESAPLPKEKVNYEEEREDLPDVEATAQQLEDELISEEE